MTKERVLVTGAAGFLGSHLCDRFIKEGFFVIAMDNLITGDKKNISHLFSHPDFEFVEMLEHGMPPTFGFGFGERLFAFMENLPIRETQLFPLVRPKH